MKPRTCQQNRAIHLYLSMLAEALNANSLTVKDVLTKPIDIPWNVHTAYDLLWLPISDAIGGSRIITTMKLRAYLFDSFGVAVELRDNRDDFLSEVAEKLNDAGLEISSVLDEAPDIPWNERLAKNLLWRRIQIERYGKESTTELSTLEVNEVYRIIDRHMAQTHGVSVPFPSEEGHAAMYEEKKA